MPPSQPLLERYHSRLDNLRILVSAGLVTIWDELGTYTEAEMETFVARATPILAGAKTATVATSSAFFALALNLRPVAVSANDVPTEPRITHPFLATWHALKEGRPIPEAISAGRSQAEAVGFDFVQSTARRTGDYVARSSGRDVRWRRAPGSKACSWCRTVARQVYRTAESADFGHDRCDCVAVPA